MRGLEIGELRIGAGAYPAQMSVGRAVGRLTERHPALRVDVMADDLRGIIVALLAVRLDLAVVELSLVAGEPRLVPHRETPCAPGVLLLPRRPPAAGRERPRYRAHTGVPLRRHTDAAARGAELPRAGAGWFDRPGHRRRPAADQGRFHPDGQGHRARQRCSRGGTAGVHCRGDRCGTPGRARCARGMDADRLRLRRASRCRSRLRPKRSRTRCGGSRTRSPRAIATCAPPRGLTGGDGSGCGGDRGLRSELAPGAQREQQQHQAGQQRNPSNT